MVDGPSKFRALTGPARVAERALLSALTLVGAAWALQAYELLPHAIFREQYLGLFLSLALGAVFLSVKSHRRSPASRVPWYDGLLCLAGLAVGAYVVVMYPTIAYRLGVLTPDKVWLGVLAILLVLEATRRLVGWTMVAVGATFILYAKFAYLLPGPLHARGATWERIAVYLYLDTNALYGLPLAVAATIVVAFIFFGQALYAVGGDKFFTNAALVALGRYRGGPAKVAVVASSLFGTVSGSAVSNVVLDGPITIPMMKRAGYAPHLAAAIEAVASTGGQLMPPVMGVAAFLIAEYLAIPYGEVALAAMIPALLYYVALFVQVDLEAAKGGLAGLPRAELPRAGQVLRQGWSFLVPLGVLVYTLMVAVWQAGRAGMAAVIATLVVGLAQREDRLTLRKLLAAIEATGRVLLDIVVITALAGFVIGVLQLSGLGFRLSALLVGAAGGNAVVLLGLTAVVCVLLGMGMPTAVIYVILAVLVGPALVQLGIVPLGAHLFLLYFGMLSMITPPICLATYAAASIARADFMTAGWAGVRFGIVAYVVPFFFVYHPALLLHGSFLEVLGAVGTAVAGVILIGIAAAGFLFRPLSWPTRGLMAAAGVLLFPAPDRALWLASNVLGLTLGAALVLWERSVNRLQPAHPAQPPRGIS